MDRELLRSFDMLTYLDDIGKDYTTEGKNTTEGWANMKCVFCHDQSNHLGIHYEGESNYSCWLCGAAGDVIDFIRRVENLSFPIARNIVETFQSSSTLRMPKKIYNSKLMPEGVERIYWGKEPE